MKDHLRPADYQINNVFRCTTCHRETEISSIYDVGRCGCGGDMELIGETYPANSAEWDEERNDYYSPWHRRS